MFKYNGNNEKIIKAVDLANDYALLNYVYQQILKAPKYDYSDAPNDYIAKNWFEYLRLVDIEINVYFPRYKYSKALGYFSPDKPKNININGYKINSLDYEQLVSLFYHESGHSWNESNKNYSVHHGDNSPVGKENTMMYSVNRYVYDYFNYENKKTYLTPWYIKIFRFLKWW